MILNESFLLKLRLKNTLLLLFITCLYAVSLPGISSAATTALMFNPMRLIFTDRQRAIQMHIVNPGNKTMNVAISLVTKRRGEDGKFYVPETETDLEKMSKDMIRFSPRRAKIDPGKRQVVKVMVRKPKNLPPGEYQTRIQFTPLPDPTISPTVAQQVEGKAININMLVASSLPIIIQHEEPLATVTPTAISITKHEGATSGLVAEVQFARQGNVSSFGNAYLSYISADSSGKMRSIGKTIGMAIYLPSTERKVTVRLNNVTREELSSGTLRVGYRPDNGVPQKRKGLAEVKTTDFSLPL